jgi:hypothetical protein
VAIPENPVDYDELGDIVAVGGISKKCRVAVGIEISVEMVTAV